jgi:hypothetical protein
VYLQLEVWTENKHWGILATRTGDSVFLIVLTVKEIWKHQNPSTLDEIYNSGFETHEHVVVVVFTSILASSINHSILSIWKVITVKKFHPVNFSFDSTFNNFFYAVPYSINLLAHKSKPVPQYSCRLNSSDNVFTSLLGLTKKYCFWTKNHKDLIS